MAQSWGTFNWGTVSWGIDYSIHMKEHLIALIVHNIRKGDYKTHDQIVSAVQLPYLDPFDMSELIEYWYKLNRL